MKDRERAVVTGIRQGAGVTLAAAQLRICQDLHGVEPRFSGPTTQAEQVKLVGGFAAAAVMADVDVEGILRGGG